MWKILIVQIRKEINCSLISRGLFSEEQIEGARGVMVIVMGNGHGDTSSNPRRD